MRLSIPPFFKGLLSLFPIAHGSIKRTSDVSLFLLSVLLAFDEHCLVLTWCRS